MSESEGIREERAILVAVLLVVVLGWWLAMRRVAMRVRDAGAQVVPALAPVEAVEVRALRAVRLEDRRDDYLTVKELESYLHLCGKSIRKEMKEGGLPSHRLRGKITVKGSDALAWLSARKEG